MPVKLEFIVQATQHAFNLNKAHIKVLKCIKENDPSLEIVPSKAGQAKCTDLLQFPANEKDCSAMFHHAIDIQPTEACEVIVKHSLITNQKFSDLKFQNARLMDYIFANKIWILYNQSDTLQMEVLGFIGVGCSMVEKLDDGSGSGFGGIRSCGSDGAKCD
jgi:hypothetical protein